MIYRNEVEVLISRILSETNERIKIMQTLDYNNYNLNLNFIEFFILKEDKPELNFFSFRLIFLSILFL